MQQNTNTKVGGNTNRRQRSRGWIFTLNNPDILDKNDVEYMFHTYKASYLIYSLERGACDGTLHYQGFVYWDNAKMFNVVHGYIPRAHIEPARSNERCIDYCQKEDTHIEGPWTFGTAPQQGKRNDLEAAIKALKDHGMGAVIQDFPEIYVKYHRGLEAIEYQLQNERSKEDPGKRIWIWGPAGSGKTRFVHDLDHNTYVKDGTMWWNGYVGQKTVLIDDFDGKWPYRDFLRILDRYRYQAQIKGGYVKLPSCDIYITCEFPPWHFWEGNELDQVQRRLTEVIKMNKPNGKDEVDN